MYTVRNTGAYPVIIRDLNLHIAGGKTVDLDSLLKQDTVRRSTDLERLIKSKKIELVGKEKKDPPKITHAVIPVKEKTTQEDLRLLIDLKKDLSEIKDLIRSGVSPVAIVERHKEEHDEETLKRIVDLQVKNLSGDGSTVEKNFEAIGKSTEKNEKLDDLLNILDGLDDKGE